MMASKQRFCRHSCSAARFRPQARRFKLAPPATGTTIHRMTDSLTFRSLLGLVILLKTLHCVAWERAAACPAKGVAGATVQPASADRPAGSTSPVDLPEQHETGSLPLEEVPGEDCDSGCICKGAVFSSPTVAPACPLVLWLAGTIAVRQPLVTAARISIPAGIRGTHLVSGRQLRAQTGSWQL